MAVSFSDINELLASLNGEDSAVVNASRTRFINAVGQDIWDRKDFLFKRTSTSLTLAGDGTVAMPANFGYDKFLDIREVVTGQDNDNIYSQIDIKDRDKYTLGDYKYWITGSNGSYTLNTTETDLATVSVQYDSVWVNFVDLADTCTIPKAMPIAAGAFVYLKKYDDPESDTSVETNMYEAEISKLIIQDDRQRGVRRFQGQTERSGYHIGNVDRQGN